MNAKAVLFDMDGVIVDSLPAHAQATQNVLRRYGFELSKEEYYNQFGGISDVAGFTQYFERMKANIDVPTVVSQKAAEYEMLCNGHLAPCAGAVEFIESLARQGLALGVVTGALKQEAELTLSLFGVRELFRILVTAEDVSHSKPHPQGYLKGLEALGVNSEHCIVIEDAPEGIEAAGRAGMRCVAVTNTYPASELTAATLVVDRLDEIDLAGRSPFATMKL